MKHEKFKLFSDDADNIISNEGLYNFLSSGITPRSVSIHYEGTTATACIGYDDEQGVPEGYHLVKINISNGSHEKPLTLEGTLEGVAAQLSGVICQDVLFGVDDVTVIFLTTK